MKQPVTVVILAAGLGTRMRSRKAKVLHEAGGLALVEHVVRAASAIAEPDRTVVVTGHQAEQVEELLAGRGLGFARQTDQKGTGHALEVCRAAVPDYDGLLVVLYGDCPLLATETLRSLISHHVASGAAATVIATSVLNPTGYGRCILDAENCVRCIVEEKVASPEQRAVTIINSGIYCFNAPRLWDLLGRITPNPVSGEYYLTDIVEILNASGDRVSAMLHPDANELLGINTRLELAGAEAILRARKNQELMLAGVTMLRPETVLVDADVSIGADTVVEPSAQITGHTTIGENCRIGTGAIIRDTEIENNVEIAPYTIINASVIRSGASVGPFARLRLQNEVGAGAHIGNFVELKKTKFGSGAKAGHLAYLGDSDIGAAVNIGAGTITCNYDGKRKHTTTVGEGAFVGSNSTLVAPVEVSAHSYVAAGSVITHRVPEHALGIGRGRQANIDGWVARRKQDGSSA